MGIRKTVEFYGICDHCGYTFLDRITNRRVFEKKLRNMGWKKIGGYWFCPRCPYPKQLLKGEN